MGRIVDDMEKHTIIERLRKALDSEDIHAEIQRLDIDLEEEFCDDIRCPHPGPHKFYDCKDI